MNKASIEKFAIWARNKLIADITYKAGLMGISEKGIAQPLSQSTSDLQFFDIGTKEYAQVAGKTAIDQRNALVNAIKRKEQDSDYKTAFAYIIEEVAYTWFNRLVAIRFMEVNDYLPSRIRVLSSENPAKKEPDFVTTPFDTDLDFTDAEQNEVLRLKDENKLDELFRMLFIKQCNKLHEILPELFEKTDDYTEALLTISFTDSDGIVYHLVHDIEEDDFNVEASGQVEIIGWLYQYYISEKHDQIINIYKGTIKKEDIPAATQLFTTDWVVRYMVDNSLGRYWIERNPNSTLKDKLEFFVTPKNGEIKYVNEKIEPQELAFLDPCMGSGHILVYAFDVLMEIYREVGYTDRDAAKSILENNIFGLDIDKRAYQLAYFSLLMKARSYNRRILTSGIEPNVCAIEESNGFDKFSQNNITVDKKQNVVGEYLLDVFRHAKEIGSLQTVEAKDYVTFESYLDECGERGDIDIFSYGWTQHTLPLMKKLTKQAAILSRKYEVVCTNPPYMGKLEGKLKDFVVDRYKPYSGDLFSVFMYRNFAFCKQNGYSGFMTPFVWMFIKTYENLRNYIISNKAITTLVQMEYSAFEEATVPICSFVLQNNRSSQPTMCFRLSDFRGGMEVQKQKVLEALANPDCGYLYEAQQDNFAQIPGTPIAYWVSDGILNAFANGKKVGDYALARNGMKTGDNGQFLRLWWEIQNQKMATDIHTYAEAENSDAKWFPYNKGGEFRKWYGNNDYVVDWENCGERIFGHAKQDGRNVQDYPPELKFKPSLSWSLITSSKPAFRYKECNLSDIAGMSLFTDKNSVLLYLALLNSNMALEVLRLIAPTINFQAGDIARVPVVPQVIQNANIIPLAEENITLSKQDWDSFETSWDFLVHPLILATEAPDLNGGHKASLSDCYAKWEALCNKRFNQLKANEEELNRIFIDIYGLHDELTPEVEDKDVTVRKADLQRDIKSLLSYAVGCMFGRYSLDESGLAYAGGDWDASKYSAFIPDKDNCIPITDEEYFEDDMVGQFIGWMKKAFGTEHLEENLDFIANALGNKGKTSREVIRNYFLNDFIKDHIKMYQKRPIYWMFDSGKQNGFKALVYMHRWNADTVGNLRVEYLHRMQRVYESEITRMQEVIDNNHDSREVSAANKRKEKLQKQLKETKDYDAQIAHIALSRIDIDLDDGVKVNYEKVQTAPNGKVMKILAKI